LKLTAQNFRVKPLSAVALFAACVITGVGVLLLGGLLSDEEAHVDQFGATMAASLASQAIEPFLEEDGIHLGVLANRMVELPEVAGVSFHTVAENTLALSGDVTRGRTFTRPIAHDAAILGFVRLHIDEGAFPATPSPAFYTLGLAWMILVPTLAVLIAGFGPISLPIRPAARAGSDTAERPDEPLDESLILPEAPPDRTYLVTVNLFNQLSLAPEQSALELEFARDTVRAVADHYHASLEDLPGTGLLISLPDNGNDDRPFHAVCTAMALSRVFADADSWGRYRLGVHVRQDGIDDDDSLSDAAVLSALARDNSVVISQTLHRIIPFPERIVTDPLDHPLLEDLATIGGRAHLSVRLADPHQDLIEQLLEEFDYPDRSTARESTF
jgi:hypothetical protein